MVDQNDEQLLRRFVHRADGEAFEALVRRYGGLVYATCRRLLPNAADADDAFQTTFLMLAHDADSIRHPAALGRWLYQVASRVSLQLRRRSTIAARHEREAVVARAAQQAKPEEHAEILQALDEELNRLPPKYRDPLILCYLASKSREEAARILGLTVDALRGRLERARAELRTRLSSRDRHLKDYALLALMQDQTSGRFPSPEPIVPRAVDLRQARLRREHAKIREAVNVPRNPAHEPPRPAWEGLGFDAPDAAGSAVAPIHVLIARRAAAVLCLVLNNKAAVATVIALASLAAAELTGIGPSQLGRTLGQLQSQTSVGDGAGGDAYLSSGWSNMTSSSAGDAEGDDGGGGGGGGASDGQGWYAPEPSGLAVLVAGGVALLCRRSRSSAVQPGRSR